MRWVCLLLLVAACTGSAAPTQSATPKGSASTTLSDPTAGWVPYRSVSGRFSFKHPSDWFIGEVANQGLVQVGMGTIRSDPDPHPLHGPVPIIDILISSWGATASDVCSKLITTEQSERVTIAGVDGLRQTGNPNCQGDQGVPVVQYLFATHGRSYVFEYAIQPNAVPLSQFDAMVRDTVHFSG